VFAFFEKSEDEQELAVGLFEEDGEDSNQSTGTGYS